MNLNKQDLEDLKDLEKIIIKEVIRPADNCWEILAQALSIEQEVKEAVENLEDKSKLKEITGLTYEETLELRQYILQDAMRNLEYINSVVEQALNNLDVVLKKIVEKKRFFGFVCFLLLAKNDARGYKKIETEGYRTLNNLLFGEEDRKAFVIAEELAKILPVCPPNHRGKIKALQYFANRVWENVSKIIENRYPLPDAPVTFVREVSDIPDEKDLMVEFIRRNDTKKEIEITIIEYIDKLSPQAKAQRGLGEFLLENCKSGIIYEYVWETEEGIRVDTQKIQKDSGIPLRTIERFLRDLKKVHRQKRESNLHS